MTQVADSDSATPEVDVRQVTITQPPLRHFKKIAIVGFTSHRDQAPYVGPAAEEWAIWGINDLYIDIPEVANERLRWFQMHTWMEITKWAKVPDTARPLNLNGGPPHPRDPNHVAWLVTHSQNIPIFVRKKVEEMPLAYEYPFEIVFHWFAQRLPSAAGKMIYFTNSISYMIGLAIMELVDPETERAYPGAELGVWGVDMMMAGGAGSEYGYQRPSIEWLLGYAMGAGITVHLPIETDLLKTAYPYGDEVGAAYRARLDSHRRDLIKRKQQIDAELNQYQGGAIELAGAINALEWTLRSHMPGDSEFAQDVPNTALAPRPGSHRLKSDILNRIKLREKAPATEPASDGAEP